MMEKDINLDFMLFTPGPVYVPKFVLDVMAKENDTHRGKKYQVMHESIRENMQYLLGTKNEILIFPSSGSGIMEACARNLLADDEKGLFFSCGAFGDRWAKIAQACGKNIDFIQVEYGEAVTPEIVEEQLKKDKYSLVCVTYNETSTGVTNPIDKIAPIVKATGALFCIDSVSAMGGIPINVDEWKIDVALASVQKAFGVPPGIAVCSISEDALNKSSTVEGKGLYLDFNEIDKRGKLNECPVTPPISQVRSLMAVLEKIKETGKETVFKNQIERSQMIRDWAVKEGFEVFGPEGYQSNTVVTITNSKNIDAQKFVDGLLAKGYKIVNGYGAKLKGKTFRMAAMGWYTKDDVKKMLNAASEVLKEL